MATKVKDIGVNAFEDGVEDFAYTVMYRRMKSITDPLKDKYKGDSAFDEAMNSFIDTLAVGLQMYAMQKVMSFFFDRGAKYLSAMYTFIVAGKLKKALSNKLKTSKFKGLKAFKIVGKFLDLDRTKERIEMAKIVQSNIDSYDRHKMHYEKQNNSIQHRLDTMTNSVSNYKGTKDSNLMLIFNDLTARGAWQNTQEHKKIYQNATGIELSKRGLVWSKVCQELNKYTQFYTTANGQVNNLTSSITNLVMTKG